MNLNDIYICLCSSLHPLKHVSIHMPAEISSSFFRADWDLCWPQPPVTLSMVDRCSIAWDVASRWAHDRGMKMKNVGGEWKVGVSSSSLAGGGLAPESHAPVGERFFLWVIFYGCPLQSRMNYLRRLGDHSQLISFHGSCWGTWQKISHCTFSLLGRGYHKHPHERMWWILAPQTWWSDLQFDPHWFYGSSPGNLRWWSFKNLGNRRHTTFFWGLKNKSKPRLFICFWVCVFSSEMFFLECWCWALKEKLISRYMVGG